MAKNDTEYRIMKILEDLNEEEMGKLEQILNTRNIQGENIPRSKLEKLDAKKAMTLFKSHYSYPREALQSALEYIPRKDLIAKIDEIEAGMKNKSEAQNNETVTLTRSYPINSDRPPYTGKYTLSDLQDYAVKNQAQLIRHLEEILKPREFDTLKNELIYSELNINFSFTAQKYYELFSNIELNEFLKSVFSGKKSEKIPKKLLSIMFSMKKTNHKRKAQEQMQKQGNINLKETQSVNIPDDDGNDPDEDTLRTENKMFQTHTTEPNSGNEEGNVPYKVMAIKKWYEIKKKNDHKEAISFDYIGIHEHKTYCCFIAQDVLQFKLPDDPDYCILGILQDKRDLTTLRKLKKKAEFELQFNMAVLDVQNSEVISSGGFFCVVRANNSSAESEDF